MEACRVKQKATLASHVAAGKNLIPVTISGAMCWRGKPAGDKIAGATSVRALLIERVGDAVEFLLEASVLRANEVAHVVEPFVCGCS